MDVLKAIFHLRKPDEMDVPIPVGVVLARAGLGAYARRPL